MMYIYYCIIPKQTKYIRYSSITWILIIDWGESKTYRNALFMLNKLNKNISIVVYNAWWGIG